MQVVISISLINDTTIIASLNNVNLTIAYLISLKT